MVRFNSDEEISPNLNDVEFRFTIPGDRFSHDPIESSAVEPRTDSVHNDYDYDEAQRTLSLLEKYGSLLQQDFQPKIFCPAWLDDLKKAGFKVKSDRFVWNVMPVNNENIEQIPQNLIRDIGYLVDNNVIIRDTAIAKPTPQEGLRDVVKQEFVHEAKVVSKISFFFLSLIAAAMKHTVNNSTIAPGIVESPKLVDLPDPVLLVMIDEKWVEIGRWE